MTSVGGTLAVLAPTAGAVVLLMVITVGVLTWSRSPHRFAPALAVIRGAVQLGLISLVLGGVITSPMWVACALLVMFTVAAMTATRRIGFSREHFALMALGMALGVVVTLVIVFATGAIEAQPRYLLALGGIVIGNTMSIATLAGRRLRESTSERWDEVEGWLALGATPRQATLDLARAAVYSALIPSTDQTKTTGLVTLPGAFVGAIFGGISPLEAGRFQIVVLASIMAAGALTAVVLVRGLAPATLRPDAPD
ncbi:ABC transporter permease [Arthrobacter sp. NamB2]|uniref:ABC transporter permease n=1 Tax=Arthrobacter sp. NamB2 TaxID=2576035 RepID=UPI0021D53325|nr:ABC transporter permease [Arthrobacter sp. NamB2]